MANRIRHRTFPAWAPESLLEHRAKILRSSPPPAIREVEYSSYMHSNVSKQIECIDRLVTDPRMEDVWSAISKRISLAYANVIWQGIFQEDFAWSITPKMTKAEFTSHHKEIQEHARELAELLQKTGDSSLLFLHSFMKESDWDRLKDSFHERGVTVDSQTLLYASIGRMPFLPAVLGEVARRAEERGRNPNALTQPNAKDARQHHFIEFMATWIMDTCAKPLHSHVATLANVLLDANETADSVSQFLKYRRGHQLRKKKARKLRKPTR